MTTPAPSPGHRPPKRPGSPAPRSPRRLWPLAIPAVLYCLAPLVANRIEPRIGGIPFLVAYVLAVTLVSPVLVWAVARRDPLYRTNAPEPVPADPSTEDPADAAPADVPVDHPDECDTMGPGR